MLPSDGAQLILRIADIPEQEDGAPDPILLVGEHTIIASYWCMETKDPAEYGPTVPVAILTFENAWANYFGKRNESGHVMRPLVGTGYGRRGCFRVEHSAWIRDLEATFTSETWHNPALFESMTHYLLAFHDTYCECVAGALHFKVMELHQNEILPTMVAALRDADSAYRLI